MTADSEEQTIPTTGTGHPRRVAHGSIRSVLVVSHVALALGIGILAAAGVLYLRWNTTPQEAKAQVTAEANRIGTAVAAKCCDKRAMIEAADQAHTAPEAVVIMWIDGVVPGYRPTGTLGDLGGVRYSALLLAPTSSFAGIRDFHNPAGVADQDEVLGWVRLDSPSNGFYGGLFVDRGYPDSLSATDWWIVGGLVALGILLGLLAAGTVARRITHPLRTLSLTTYRAALGESVDPLVPSGLRDIDILSHTIQESIDLGHFSTRSELSKFRRHRALMMQLSHDLQGPTDTITLQLQALAELEDQHTADGADRRARLRADVERQVANLNAKIREVVRRASGDGQIDDAERIVDLSDIVRRSVEDFDSLITFSRVACSVSVDDHVRVWAYPVALSGVVRELIRNALRHTDGSDIAVALTAEGGDAVLVVSDSGPGIPASERSRALERGSQGSGSDAGLGLGLAMAREELEQIGARMELGTSARLGGLEVTLTFPLATGHLVIVPRDSTTGASDSGGGAPPGDPVVR
jgi:signal transduction histidine kinase